MEELTHRLGREREVAPGSKLSDHLLKRVVLAAVNCPGFTPLMKDDLASFVDLSPEEVRQYALIDSAGHWRHQYAIAPKIGVPFDVIEVIITTIVT